MRLRRAQPLILGILILFSCAPIAFAQASDTRARAQEILEQTRAALGGDAVLKSIESLSASGDFRSGTGHNQASGDVQLDLLLPDKIMRTMKWSPLQDMKVTTVEVMNGKQVWTDSQEKDSRSMLGAGTLGGMGRGGGRGGRRSGGGGGNAGSTGSGGSKGIHAAPNLMADIDAQQIASDFACMLTGFLLHLPDSAHVEISSEDNDRVEGVQADYLKIDLGHGSVIRMAVDQKTHRPVMAAYNLAPGNPEAKDDPSKPEITRIQIYFSEYKPIAEKKVGTVWLPHQITKTRDGLTVDDMHLTKFQLNPSLKPKEFEQTHS